MKFPRSRHARILHVAAVIISLVAVLYGYAALTRHSKHSAGNELSSADVDRILASKAYAAHFDEAYAKIIGSRRFGIYSHPRCQIGLDGWRYRPQDHFRPFKTDMDWSAQAGVDSNWSWYHHSLAIIDCYMTRHAGDAADVRGIQDVQKIIQDWMRDNDRPHPANPQFSWGDHTTALRLRTIIYLFAELRHEGALGKEFQEELVNAVRVHTERLLRDPKIIRVRHNHALDQVYALALSHRFFPFLDYPGFVMGEEVQRRFEVERDYLVAADGVETENSPAYHMWVPVRVATMERDLGLVRKGTEKQIRNRNNGSLDFATWIQKPDGYLPQIGDTAPGKKAQIRLPGQQELPAFANYLYAQSAGKRGVAPRESFRIFPESGYFIYRDDWLPPLADDTQMVLKCGFRANGHRHSDDGTITLSARGQEWLVDTGMYGYQASPQRHHALGPSAHNISYISGETVRSTQSRRYQRYSNRWGLSDFVHRQGAARGEVTCTSFMYADAIYKRAVAVGEGKIRMVDSFSFDGSPRPIATRFNIPYDKDISLQVPGSATICSGSGDCVRIKFDLKEIQAAVVIDGATTDSDAFRTSKYLHTEPTRVLELRWRQAVRRATFDILL
jgi:hypothetical protein